MGLNTLQKILSILMVLLLFALALADISARVFGMSAAPQEPDTANGTCQQLLTNGDLESSGGWQFGSTPASAAVVNSPVHGGSGAIRMGMVAPANAVAHSSAYQRVTLPAGAAQLLLTFWERPSGGSDGADFREVVLLRTNFTALRSLSKQTSAGNDQWGERTFDLTDLAGQTLYLYFNVYNNGSGSQLANYIDDIVLANCSTSPTATATAPATATVLPTPTVANSATPTPPPATSQPTVTPVPTATPLGNAVVLRAASVDAGDASQVAIPLEVISLPAGQNVGALSIDLLYDATRLSASACTDGGAYDLLLCNTDEPGRVQLAALAATGVDATGLLATLQFTISGDAQSTIPLELHADSMINADGVDLAVSTQNGQITFNCDPNEDTCGNSGSPDKSHVYLPIMRR